MRPVLLPFLSGSLLLSYRHEDFPYAFLRPAISARSARICLFPGKAVAQSHSFYRVLTAELSSRHIHFPVPWSLSHPRVHETGSSSDPIGRRRPLLVGADGGLSGRPERAFLLMREVHPISAESGVRIPAILIVLAHETASTSTEWHIAFATATA